MKLTLIRKYKKDSYTIGKLYIDGKYFSDTIEDADRGLTTKMSLEEISKKKIYGKTAIPIGLYRVSLNVVSPKYGNIDFYKKNCNGGRVPRLLNVPGFDGVLIHAGNSAEDSMGCILPGINKEVGKVLNSREFCKKLYNILFNCKESIEIEIK